MLIVIIMTNTFQTFKSNKLPARGLGKHYKTTLEDKPEEYLKDPKYTDSRKWYDACCTNLNKKNPRNNAKVAENFAKYDEKNDRFGIKTNMNNRQGVTANKTTQTSFIKIPIDIETVAKTLEEYEKFGKPILVKEIKYYQFVTSKKVMRDCLRYLKETPRALIEKQNMNYPENEEIEDDDENYHRYKHNYTFCYEKGKEVTSDEEEPVQHTFYDPCSEPSFIEDERDHGSMPSFASESFGRNYLDNKGQRHKHRFRYLKDTVITSDEEEPIEPIFPDTSLVMGFIEEEEEEEHGSTRRADTKKKRSIERQRKGDDESYQHYINSCKLCSEGLNDTPIYGLSRDEEEPFLIKFPDTLPGTCFRKNKGQPGSGQKSTPLSTNLKKNKEVIRDKGKLAHLQIVDKSSGMDFAEENDRIFTPLSEISKLNYSEKIDDIERQNNEIPIEDDESFHHYKTSYKFRYKKGNMVTSDEGEPEIQPEIVDPSFKTDYRKEKELGRQIKETEMDEETDKEVEMYKGMIKFPKTNLKKTLSFPSILSFGGWNLHDLEVNYIPNAKAIYEYDPLRNCWEALGEMPVSRSYHTAVLVENDIFIIGGFDHNIGNIKKRVVTNDVVSYNINLDEWYQRAHLRHSRAHHNSAVINGVIYTLGGKDNRGRILKSVEKYDPYINKWVELEDMPYPVIGAASCVFKECIFVIGGQTSNSNAPYLSSVSIYNPSNNRWSQDFELPYPVAYASCTQISNSIWLFGGTTLNSIEGIESSQSVLMLDVQRRKWIDILQLSEPRSSSSCVSVDSYIYIIGGINTREKNSVSTVEGIQGIGKPVARLESLPLNLTGMAAIVLNPADNLMYSHCEINAKIKKVFSEHFLRRLSELTT